MFLRQVVMRQGMPFDVAEPNAQTRRAIGELENPDKRATLKKHATTEAMLDDILGSRGNHAKKGT
jgi:antitoxin component of RelBE/YafQ-DinJ toxin-antitoxin module